jgi:hypothetical protein
MNFKQIKAIEQANKRQILAVNPEVPERSGIYFLLREENGFRYGYIGQAKHLLTRLAQHLKGYQHIDLSLKKHGLYSEENQTGYKVHFLEFPESELNEQEQKYIKMYADKGFQMLNATSGSQGEGKKALDNQKATKGYLQGLANGYMNARKDIAHLFKLHLDYTTKRENPTVNQQKALQKFADFLDWENKE